MQDQTQKLKAIRRLLGSFAERRGPAGETMEQRADRLALVTHGYLTAIDGFDIGLVEAGVDIALRGELPGHDMSFAPTAPQFATCCRMAAERAARTAYLSRVRTPALPAPDIVHTDEERARAKTKVAEFVASVSDDPLNEEAIAIRNARWAKVNARFDPPQDDDSLTDRLHLKRGADYTVGAPESDDAAA